MHLVNFDLESASCTTTLLAHDLAWDLHSFATFEGLEVRAGDSCAVLHWTVPASARNPWGSPRNTYRGCSLTFRGLHAIHLTPRNPDAELADDQTLADVSKVIPELGTHRHREAWAAGAPFNLRFEFDSGRTIEIVAAEAELTGVR